MTREDWIWIVVIACLVGLLVLRGFDKLSEANFMELVRYIIVATLGLLAGIGYAMLRLKK